VSASVAESRKRDTLAMYETEPIRTRTNGSLRQDEIAAPVGVARFPILQLQFDNRENRVRRAHDDLCLIRRDHFLKDVRDRRRHQIDHVESRSESRLRNRETSRGDRF
jgi:hypothetical protein